MKKIIISFLIFIISCATTPYIPRSFVVSRDVPDNPSLAIISDTDICTSLEEMILEFGIKLYAPPATVRTVQEVTAQKSDSGASAGKTVSQSYNVQTTNADYILSVNRESYYYYRVRIIKVKDQEILTSYLQGFNPRSPRRSEILKFKFSLHDAFNKIGFKVKECYLDYIGAARYLYANKISIKSIDDWNTYIQSGKKPYYIPDKPDEVYNTYGWKSWDAWFSIIHNPPIR